MAEYALINERETATSVARNGACSSNMTNNSSQIRSKCIFEFCMNRYIEYCSVSHRSTIPVNGTISKLFNVVQIIYVIILIMIISAQIMRKLHSYMYPLNQCIYYFKSVQSQNIIYGFSFIYI